MYWTVLLRCFWLKMITTLIYFQHFQRVNIAEVWVDHCTFLTDWFNLILQSLFKYSPFTSFQWTQRFDLHPVEVRFRHFLFKSFVTLMSSFLHGNPWIVSIKKKKKMCPSCFILWHNFNHCHIRKLTLFTLCKKTPTILI